MSSSLVVSDISTTVDENEIRRELMQRYDGIKQVTRWYFDPNEDYPMTCVQVDFDSDENMQKAFAKGTIVIGGICRRVSVAKQIQCHRCQQIGHKTHECFLKPLNEQDLINMFEQQKKQLMRLMNNIEVKLNEVIARH